VLDGLEFDAGRIAEKAVQFVTTRSIRVLNVAGPSRKQQCLVDHRIPDLGWNVTGLHGGLAHLREEIAA
jgi:hypothetical protein